jgi:ethanolamine utilization protein EutN
MLLARVVGNVWGARQAPGLQGLRLLLVRPLTARPAGAAGDPELVDADHPTLAAAPRALVVADRLGAGPGELVLVAHGSRCRDLTLGPAVPTKEVTVAIVDRAQVIPGPARQDGGRP